MKRFFTSIITCATCIIVCYGQTISLKECIATGIANNLSLTNARIEIDKGQISISQNRSRLLPEINGLIQISDYLINPVNVTTGTLLGNKFSDDPTWQTIKSMKYNSTAGISLSMPLFNKSVLAAIDVARIINKINTLSYDKAVDDLTMQISTVYYLAQASQSQENLTGRNVERMEELFEITSALFNQGVAMEVDLNRVAINLQTLKTQQKQYRTLYEQQKNLLRFLLDIAPEKQFDVICMSDTFELTQTQSNEINKNLPDLRILDTQIELTENRIRSVKAGYLPTFMLTGYLGGIGYTESIRHISDNWFGNSYIGLSIRIPIYDANTKRLQIKRHRYDLQQTTNRLNLLQKQINQKFANAILQLNQNKETYQTQSENYIQAENVYNVTKEQYKEGVASMSTLLQDEMQLRLAQSACTQALCQCYLSQLELLKLSGNLSYLSK